MAKLSKKKEAQFELLKKLDAAVAKKTLAAYKRKKKAI